MAIVRGLVLLLFPILARGTNSCLDPASDVYKCSTSSSATQIILDGCGITDDDMGDIAKCMDDFGRETMTRVYLRYNELTTVRANLFQDCGRLERIYLSHNLLAVLPVAVFSGLETLKWLSLDSNSLTALPEGIFQELVQLEVLWLGQNSLTTLPSEIFSGLGALQELFLSDNPGLQCAPTNFAQYVEVDNITSERCGCTPIEAVTCEDGVFCVPGEFGYTCATPAPSPAPTLMPTGRPSPAPTSLPTRTKNPCLDPAEEFYVCSVNGTELTLDYCGIYNEDVEDVEKCLDAFGRDSATRVSMRFNYLTTLPEGLFQGLGHVEQLYLNNNKLSSLPAEIFQPLGKLKVLNLNGNALTTLSAGLFQGLWQLQRLWINFSRLTTLPAELFYGLGELISLDLRMNPDLECVPENDAETVAVSEISSHGCGCSLATTLLCDTDQACVPGKFGYTCATPSPTPAPVAPGNNTCLDPASDAYVCSNSGTEIDFSYCGLTDENWEEVAACLDIFGRGNITHLHLRYNFLTRVPADLFQRCGQLEQIYLNDNRLTTLPAEAFEGVGNLKVLGLNRNSLIALPGNLFQKHDTSIATGQLQELLLNMNQLSTLPAELLKDLPLLEQLDLRLNPDLQCVPTNSSAVTVDVDDDFSPEMCQCNPAQAVTCTFGSACFPGEFGFVCSNV